MAKKTAKLDESADRLRRLQSLWAYLPVFRVVGETEHLPTASQRLGISPSALSRTIRMIERELGEPLFARSGRNIELNAAGRNVLRAVREAMRRVHQGLFSLDHDEISGITAIASRGLHTLHYVVPAIHELMRTHPNLQASIVDSDPAQIGSRLLEGRLDLWIGFEAITHGEVRSQRLGLEVWRVFCGAHHPCAKLRQVPLAALCQHEFVGLVSHLDGRTHDGWPDELERKVAFYFDDALAVRDICTQSRYLALLPEFVAQTHGQSLVRVDVDLRITRPLIASHRPTVGLPARTEAIVQSVMQAIAHANRSLITPG